MRNALPAPAVVTVSQAGSTPTVARASYPRVSSSATTATASLTAPRVETGPWSVYLTYMGVFGATGEPAETVNTSAAVTTEAFDPAVSSPPGDLEAASVDPVDDLSNFSPVAAASGDTATIPVTISPSAAPGSVVSGTLYIDDFSDSLDVFGANPIAEEVAAIPYSYTVAPG